jgi:hypothetical protein
VFQRVTTLMAMAAVLFTAACTSSTPPIVVNGKADIPAQPGAATPEGKVRLFNEVMIHLPRIEGPGNVWTIVLNDERYLDPQGPIVPEPNGGAVAKFIALRGGRRAVRFFALPPKQKEAVPTQRYEIRVTIEDAR